MTIRFRLTIGFGLIIIAMVCITAFALFQMGQIKERVDSIVDVSSRKVILAQKLKTHILTVSILEKDILLSDEQSDARQLIQKVERQTAGVTEAIAALRLLVENEQFESLKALNSHWNSYLDISAKANDLAVKETFKQASQLSQGVALQAFDKVTEHLAQLQETNFAARSLYQDSPSLLEKLTLERALVQGIESNLFNIQQAEQNLLYAESRENINQFIGEIENAELTIQEQVSQLKANPVPINRDAFDLVNTSLQTYLKYSQEIRRLIELNPKMQANELLSNEGEASLREVNRLLNDIISRNENAMSNDQSQSAIDHQNTQRLVIAVLVAAGVICALMSYFLSHSITSPLRKLSSLTQALAAGDTDVRSSIDTSSEVGELASAFNHMAQIIHQRVTLQTGLNSLATSMRGDQSPEALAQNSINCLCELLECQVGVFYFTEGKMLTPVAAYAVNLKGRQTVALGEGLVGQAALENKLVVFSDIPDGHVDYEIQSGLGNSKIKNILIQPLIQNTKQIGLIVLGKTALITDEDQAFLTRAYEHIAITMDASKARSMQNDLLEATQRQAEQLHEQQNNLKLANQDLEKSKKLVEDKAEELQKASQYKSDFLANMSHELRSPLNSMLLLSKTLSRNEDKNLTSEQVESLKYIYDGGQELLSHINDILDLSKVEAGKLDFHFELFDAVLLCNDLELAYRPQVAEKGIGFEMIIDESINSHICSDKKRIMQVLRNLISNAIKFTHEGKITLSLYHPSETSEIKNRKIKDDKAICFSVKDTGIGIPKEKCKAIFEAFQQADGSTSRKYGGTGLGLAISREFSKRLHGEIKVHSEPGKGSEFIFILPASPGASPGVSPGVSPDDKALNNLSESKGRLDDKNEMLNKQQIIPMVSPRLKREKRIKQKEPIFHTRKRKSREFSDDRGNIDQKDRVLLIIEDDVGFAKILQDQAHAKGFKCVVANNGEEGVNFSEQYCPTAITLDLGLPGLSGKEVLEALEANEATRGIPVHIISSYDDSLEINEKIKEYLTKPVTSEDLEELFHIVDLESKKLRRDHSVADLDNNVSYKFEPVNERGDERHLATKDEIDNVRDVQGVDLEHSKYRHAGKRILLVDDDVRNMFALSQIISSQGMRVVKADNGELAVSRVKESLEKGEKFDAILMDIMMPIMDGYEAIKQIRELGAECQMPILALTAKAMSGDREKCLEVGADDYLTKPLDEAKLIAQLNHWLALSSDKE